MLIVLCDLIADINMHLPSFPIEAGSVHRLTYLDLGPGGATNIAIMASRFGIPVTCLGEIGDDIFGRVVLEGLNKEGINTESILIKPGASTPMAGVIVDQQAEPAYLGITRGLDLDHLPDSWQPLIQNASALFADGWAEHAGVPKTIIAGFEGAQAADVPVFFDPGPGNPDVPEDWLKTAIDLTDILFVNDQEANHFTGLVNPDESARQLLEHGPKMVVLKHGPQGNTIYTPERSVHTPGLNVTAIDNTGAGDSMTGAVIYATLNDYSLEQTSILANATGAAKVGKRGTGWNLPTLAEIRELLVSNHYNPDLVP
jgi:sugar/nucleoside kinase (ribokinase family)